MKHQVARRVRYRMRESWMSSDPQESETIVPAGLEMEDMVRVKADYERRFPGLAFIITGLSEIEWGEFDPMSMWVPGQYSHRVLAEQMYAERSGG